MPLPALSVSIGELWLGVLVCQAVGAAAWGLRLAVGATASGVSATPATAAAASTRLLDSAGAGVIRSSVVNLGTGDVERLGVQTFGLSPNSLQEFLFGILVGVVGRHRVHLRHAARIRQAGTVLCESVLQLPGLGRDAVIGLKFLVLGFK
ncbi:Uncharacterised protein [Mycobacteroides abscessus subsp. abscessus]|nr:Uncharacterised protein [Mycobacteroides abscessus subsp. abscessus]